jgi:hypothetical protein
MTRRDYSWRYGKSAANGLVRDARRQKVLEDLSAAGPRPVYCGCLDFAIRSGSQKAAGYPTVIDGVLAFLPSIAIDPSRDGAPMSLTESRSLLGVLRPIVQDYRARIASTNGQCGGFLRTDIAPMLRSNDRVLYFGDLDLSGGQIENNTRRVLEQEVGGRLRWERVALTQEQVDAHELPVIIKRDRRYKDGRPHQAVETEALRQTVLMRILRARLDELIPEPLARVHEREGRQQRRIPAMLARHRDRR